MIEAHQLHNTTVIDSSSALISENVTFPFEISTKLYFQSDFLPTWISGVFWFVRNVEGFFCNISQLADHRCCL